MNINLPPIQHLELLQEHDRLLGLKASVSRVVKAGDVILDAGCGTGILGLLALKAGAEKVVAVDSHDLEFAKVLARENNLLESVQYLQSDLADLEPDDLPAFNVVMAMIYSGHPITDEGQVALKHSICSKFLSSGGKLIPDRIRWHAYAYDLPNYDLKQYTYYFRQEILSVANHLQLNFQPSWASDLSHRQAWNWVIHPYSTELDSWAHLNRGSVFRLLSKQTEVADIQYGMQSSLLPEHICFDIVESGRVTTIVWIRELWFEDILISSRKSISLVKQPVTVTPDEKYIARLDQFWRSTNIISLQKL